MPLTALYRYYFGPEVVVSANCVPGSSGAIDRVEAEWHRTARAHIHGTLDVSIWFTETIGDGTNIARVGLKNQGRVVAFLNVEPGDELCSFSWDDADIRDIELVAGPGDTDQPQLTIVGVDDGDRVVFEDQIELQYVWSD